MTTEIRFLTLKSKKEKVLDRGQNFFFNVVVFTLKAVPVSTQYFLTSVLVQLTRTPSVSQANYPERVHVSERNKRTQKSQHIPG